MPFLAAMIALAQLPSYGPVPTHRQLLWQAMDTNAFVHFGPNTFTDVEWGGGKEDPNLFNPSDLDCDQWVRTFKAAGFKGVILTAKHHDGFCLWPSKLSTHTVAQSRWRDGKGDVVKELSDACHRGGLKFGIYLSPWDRNHPTYGSPEYNKVFAGMLEEVLTHYGPIFEVWFDGANGEGPNGKRQVYDWKLFHDTVRRFQPNAVMFSDGGPDVRWVGNEEGHAGETCWSTVPSGRYVPGTPYYSELTEGTRGGNEWLPAEIDVSIRPGWFYHQDQDAKVKPPQRLLELYESSVGRNGVLLLNVPPDRRGHIADPDVASLVAFGKLRKQIYGHDLAKGAQMVAEDGQVRGKQWEATAGSVRGTVLFRLPAPATFDRVELREPIAKGQRIAAYVVEAREGDGWRQIARATTVGNRRILQVSTVTSDAVRIRIEDALAPPILLPIHLYRADQTVQSSQAKLPYAGKQASDGRLAFPVVDGDTTLGLGRELTWAFDGVRGEVNVIVEGSGNADLVAEVGGQTLRAHTSATGPTLMGKAAIVVADRMRLTLRVTKGTLTVRSVRFEPTNK